jgi:AcrR family transcriptional regulator
LNRKQDIIQAASRLFAEQGFEGTTTLRSAREAGVTEPLISYHFKGKDEISSYILETSFKEYFSRLTDPEHICTKNVQRQRDQLKAYLEDWRTQFVTSNGDKKGLRHKPMAFTEQGVAIFTPLNAADI